MCVTLEANFNSKVVSTRIAVVTPPSPLVVTPTNIVVEWALGVLRIEARLLNGFSIIVVRCRQVLDCLRHPAPQHSVDNIWVGDYIRRAV